MALSTTISPAMLGYVGRVAGNRAASRMVSRERRPGAAPASARRRSAAMPPRAHTATPAAGGVAGVLVDRDAPYTPDPRESNQAQEDARLAKVWADQRTKVDGTNDDMTKLANRQNLLRTLIGQEPLWASNREAGVLVDEVDNLIGLRQGIGTVLDAGPAGDKETRLVQDVGILETDLTSASVWAESYDEEIDYYNCATVDDHRAKIAEAEFAITEAEAVRAAANADMEIVSIELRSLEAEVRAIEREVSDLNTKRVARGTLSTLSVAFGVAAILVPGPWSIVLGAASLACGLAGAYVNGDFGGSDAASTATSAGGAAGKPLAKAALKAVPKLAAGGGASTTATNLAPKISKGLGVLGAVITTISEIRSQIEDSKSADKIRVRLDAAHGHALAAQPKYEAAVAAAAAAASKVEQTQAQLQTVIQEREMIARPSS